MVPRNNQVLLLSVQISHIYRNSHPGSIPTPKVRAPPPVPSRFLAVPKLFYQIIMSTGSYARQRREHDLLVRYLYDREDELRVVFIS